MKVEWLILADSAQVVGSKLFLLGGGWDRLTANSPFPLDRRCAVAVAIQVPWNETNQKRSFEIEVVEEDPATEAPRTLSKTSGQVEVGRPPGIAPGQDQRVQMALDLNLTIRSAGTVAVIARIEGQESARVQFSVILSPTAAKAARD